MPRISFLRGRPAIEVATGSNLMEQLLAHGVPVASACYGDAVCGKCRIEVVQGAANLSGIEAAEQILLERVNAPKGVRISCQCLVNGDITIDAAYW